MRVVIAAAGSRGDAVPFGVLAARLVARGHDVTVVTHASLAHVMPDGPRVVTVASDPGALLAGPAGTALRRGDLRALNRTRNVFAEFLQSFGPTTREALAGADVLVASSFAIAAVDEAMRADVPVVRAHLWPEFDRLDGPMPLLMWAYPAEFTDPSVAGQTVDVQNRFVRPGGSSHLFLLTQGYAILDNPSMPIIGRDGAEPNDTYVEQLTADAQAAVDAVVEMGVAERGRIAIGGHSYGAFMTANLLAHTDLFRTGIARSGAYNRTLTPFGFQAEQRNYWEATEVYTEMAPFTYADQVNEPILLIHGEADDNSGTFPVQTERFYAALKGLGATARYVTLPLEAHGYRARESVGHTLWEMTRWLDQYVKTAPATPPAQ